MRLFLRPFGHLAFVVAVAALSTAGKLLGERDDLGFFSRRLAQTVWRYPEVTRRGVRVAWLAWAGLFGLAISPLDPLASQWDELGLAVVPLLALCRRFAAESRAGR